MTTLSWLGDRWKEKGVYRGALGGMMARRWRRDWWGNGGSRKGQCDEFILAA